MKCRAAKRKHLVTFVIMHSGCETPNQRLLESQHGKFVGRPLVNPYWIKTEGIRLAIIPRPRGQDWLPDDISLLQRAGIDVVVSALTAAENEELGLVEESRCCQSRGIDFLSFPIEDRSVPNSSAEFTELVNSVSDLLRKEKRLQFIAEPESGVRQ